MHILTKLLNKTKYIHFFYLALSIRLIYFIFAHITNINPADCCDWGRYDQLSSQILNGNFNLDAGAFITAPFFPFFVSLIKYLSSDHAVVIIQLIQIVISSFSVFILVKSSDLIFKNKQISIIVGLLFSFYPFTFWYVIYLGQETFFQSFLILSVYYLLKFFENKKTFDLIIFSLMFTFTILTKSHLLLFIPFLLIMFLIKSKNIFKAFKNISLFFTILIILNAPFSINNYINNGYHVLSTTGYGFHFLVGHNDQFYKMVTNPPGKETQEYKDIWGMNYKVLNETKEKNKNLNHRELDKKRLIKGIEWILEDKLKATHLLFINTKNFIQPGFNKLHHSDLKWLFSFLISFPILIFAYFGIVKNIFSDFKNHLIILSMFLTMLLFSSIFYSQNRFRVITIEPFYIVYASYSLHEIYNYLKNRKII